MNPAKKSTYYHFIEFPDISPCEETLSEIPFPFGNDIIRVKEGFGKIDLT